MNKCIDCNSEIDNRGRSVRCKSCAQKELWKEKRDYIKEKEIIAYFEAGAKVKEILELCGVAKTSFYEILKRYEVEHRNGRIYTLDESVLDIEDANKYYILGLFSTDGCIGKNRNSKYIDISLQENDSVLLEDIKKYFNTNKPLSISEQQKRLTLYSEKLYKTLDNYGISEQKSLTLELKKEIPNEFKIDFLRGVFDGDGSISGDHEHYNTISLCCSASEKFIFQLKEMYESLGEEVYKYQTRQKSENRSAMWTLNRGGVPGLKLLKKLYRPGGMFLPRKYDKFLSLSRLTVDETMMETAHIFSQRSTCNRAKVGCVITNEDKRNIVAIGYNGGALGGDNHCESIFPGQCGCIHAEPNALTKGNGKIVYSTTFPCPPCAKMLINSGIREIFYSKEYRNSVQSKLLFKRAEISYKKIDREKYKWKLNS